jgi:molecular chaperone HtpG
VSFEEYISRMKEGGKHIYYITGENTEKVKRSPQLEGFKAKGIEVLFMTDPVDDFWLQMVNQYDDKILQSVTRGSADLDEKKDGEEDKEEEKSPEIEALINILKVNLGSSIKEARISKRLTSSAVCLVADDGDMDMHMERILKMHKMEEAGNSTRILELNPDNDLIKALAKSAVKEGSVENMKDASLLLLDQAKIMEGELPEDTAAFAARLAKVMTNAF